MAVKIRDEVELMGYLETLPDAIADLGHVVYVDAGEDVDTKVKEFFNNVKATGLVLFVWLGEGELDVMAGSSGYLMPGLMCMLGHVPDKKAASLLGIRKKTRECLSNCIGKILVDEETQRANDFVDRWEFRREDNRFLPSSEVGNATAYGWTMMFEIWMEVGKVVFKDIEQELE